MRSRSTENSSHESWISVQWILEFSTHTNRPQNHEKCFEHPRKIWEKSERIRTVVSISCNYAEKAKIINRFLSTFSKELFKIELFGAKTSTKLYHSKKSDVLSVFTTCDMLLTGPYAGSLNYLLWYRLMI